MKRHLAAALLLSLFFGACAGRPSTMRKTGSLGWDGGPVALTRYGLVEGQGDRYGTWVWKAVPFARPPLGELRWRAPQEPEPWSGVRYSRSFARPAVQYFPLTGRVIGTEDCLYLNIWRPRSYQTRLPVYVWIHGGGNSTGSATYVKYYLGHRLAAAGNLVFVSVNYRLGPLGWFSHPALREGRSAEDDSGNFGTLDLIQALRWIRDNITAFGGDPGTVLIAGESAGAMNVLSLLVSPPAAGLFHRAVIQSGLVSTSSPAEAEDRARRAILRVLEKSGEARSPQQAEELFASMPPEQLRAFLRGCRARKLLRCYSPGPSGMIDNPSIFTDGTVLPADGYAALERGDYPGKVPVLIGSNRDELKSFLFLSGSPCWRSELYHVAARFGSERWKAEAVDGVARRLTAAAGQPPVYAYLFGWGTPDARGSSPLPGNWGQRLGAFHSLEIPFFLGAETTEGSLVGTVLFTKTNRAGRLALSTAMQRYLVAFLHAGDPNPDPQARPPGPGQEGAAAPLPYWAPWSNAAGAAKSILFDVRGEELDIRMLDREVALEGIEAAMQAELSPELLEATRAILARPLTGSTSRR
jgi:para-nitrobenzyl esterase